MTDRDHGRSFEAPWKRADQFDSTKIAFAVIGLGGLLIFLLVGEVASPGFTDYWGYLVGQVLLVTCIAFLGETIFVREGGFSRVSYVVAVAALWGDVLGNAAGFYDVYKEYDKVTHFFGIAAVTSGAYDLLRALNMQGRLKQTPTARMWISVAVGVAVGLGWEVYEFLADVVFRTGRVYGPWDTFHDIISDTLGAISAGLLLWAFERQAGASSRGPGAVTVVAQHAEETAS